MEQKSGCRINTVMKGFEMAKKSEREMLLTQLGEECAEVIQAISKIERFGPEDTEPASHLHCGKKG